MKVCMLLAIVLVLPVSGRAEDEVHYETLKSSKSRPTILHELSNWSSRAGEYIRETLDIDHRLERVTLDDLIHNLPSESKRQMITPQTERWRTRVILPFDINQMAHILVDAPKEEQKVFANRLQVTGETFHKAWTIRNDETKENMVWSSLSLSAAIEADSDKLDKTGHIMSLLVIEDLFDDPGQKGMHIDDVYVEWRDRYMKDDDSNWQPLTRQWTPRSYGEVEGNGFYIRFVLKDGRKSKGVPVDPDRGSYYIVPTKYWSLIH